MKKFLLFCALAGFALRAAAAAGTVYTFTGAGNWSVAGNWASNLIPPATLSSGNQIIIAGTGTSVMNQNETVDAGAKLTINSPLSTPTTNALIVNGSLSVNSTFDWTSGSPNSISFGPASTEIWNGTGALNITAPRDIGMYGIIGMTGAGSVDIRSGEGVSLNGGTITVVNGKLSIKSNIYANGSIVFNSSGGINVDGATLKTTGIGNIDLNGATADLSNFGGSLYGVHVMNSLISSTQASGGGSIIITGTGNKTLGYSLGVSIDSGYNQYNLISAPLITSASGNITITGVGDTGVYSYGIRNSLGQITTTNGGNIILNGTSGRASAATGESIGIANYGTVSAAGNANISMTGVSSLLNEPSTTNTDRGGISNALVRSVIRVVNGTINLTGTGGNSGRSFGVGISVAVVEATGTGSINITGTGKTAGNANSVGINYINNGQTIVNGGNQTLNGTATEGTSARYGIFMSASNYGKIVSNGAGAITITGEGTTADFSGDNANCTIGGPTCSGTITINANTIDLPTVQSTSTLNLKPRDPATAIGLGSSTASITFSLTIAELARITSGFSKINIGDAVTGTGAVTIRGAIFNDPVEITGGSIQVTGFSGDATENQVLTARTGSITDLGDASTDITGGIVTVSALQGSIGAAGDAISIISNQFSTATLPTGSQFLSSAGTTTLYSIGATSPTTGTGTITLESGNFTLASSVDNKGTLTNNATLTIDATLNNGNAAFAGSLVNTGNLIINGSRTINNGPVSGNTGTITNTGTVTVNGTLANRTTGTVTNNGTIKGTGTITQSGTFTNTTGSHIAPGNSAGTLTVTGNFNLGSAILDAEIGGNTTALYDRLSVSGIATLTNASLNVILINGYNPGNGDLFTIINASSLNGTFSSTQQAGLSKRYNYPSAGQFSLGTPVALPLKLISFSARKVSTAGNRIYWTTGTEAGTYKFEVERSNDGKDFIVIGTVSGNGTQSDYALYDYQPLSGINYYRLKMTDISGEGSYSNIALVGNDLKREGIITIAPVPAKEVVTITNTDPLLEGTPATVTDMQGRMVYSFALNAVSSIDVRQWPAGIYSLRLASGEVVRIVKQ